VGKKYFDGLPEGLLKGYSQGREHESANSVADYEDAAIRYHRKFLQVSDFFRKTIKEAQKSRLVNSSGNNVLPKTTMPWTLTPGRIRARAALIRQRK
jgi:hypothetical protein